MARNTQPFNYYYQKVNKKSKKLIPQALHKSNLLNLVICSKASKYCRKYRYRILLMPTYQHPYQQDKAFLFTCFK
ncbi:hypothetical protein CEX98_10495 [Pseudoalteromonas piscicida]|uniref:Uncharacterized protein n=1 Tax=Pseudoalteromonas piscicida TaxID=43662 RepID=A0A2A5JQR3_PSEO7|nr:hypothetical protein CEX98_10495 [Pseudoalteromonas piscicida]